MNDQTQPNDTEGMAQRPLLSAVLGAGGAQCDCFVCYGNTHKKVAHL